MNIEDRLFQNVTAADKVNIINYFKGQISYLQDKIVEAREDQQVKMDEFEEEVAAQEERLRANELEHEYQVEQLQEEICDLGATKEELEELIEDVKAETPKCSFCFSKLETWLNAFRCSFCKRDYEMICTEKEFGHVVQ